MRNVFRFSVLLTCLLLFAQSNRLQAQVYLNYTVNQPPVLTADAGIDHIICVGDVAAVGALPPVTGGYGGYSYNWTPSGSVNNPTAANPTATPSVTTVYTLAVTDSLGCTAVDSVEIVVDTCVGINLVQGVNTFDVFPNPNHGAFQVSIELAAQFAVVKLSVIDLNGRVVYAKDLVAPGQVIRESISLQGFSKGTYFVRMEADGQPISRKMILR